jgi:uncharacterized protein YndB with AHSA1/START domain
LVIQRFRPLNRTLLAYHPERASMNTADQDIIISRVFNAPRRLVFEAWTDPEHVAQWWGPNGFSSGACAIDLRVGGVFRLDLLGPDGVIYPCKGVFHEIVKPERIVYTGTAEDGHACGSGLPPRGTVTVTFIEHDGKTTLTIHTRLASAADHEAAVSMGFNTGWAESLERLAEILETA